MTQAAPKGLALIRMGLGNRKTGVMLAFGFAAGLPYTLLLGTLNAWLGEAKINLATIGLLSWIGLVYAFKFLWSPLVDRMRLPLLDRFGRRRSWLLLCQAALAATFLALSATDPAIGIGWFALVAVIGAFAAATQDVVIDAWRIDVADDRATLGILSSIYQLGYRTAALVGGALALVLAARISWPMVYAIMGGVMAAMLIVTLLAPDTPRPAAIDPAHPVAGPSHRDKRTGLAIVGLCWTWAIVTIAAFMTRALTVAPGATPPSVGDFTRLTGPWIVVATVVVPALVAAWLNGRGAAGEGARSPGWVEHGHRALILPLSELVGRLRWGIVVVLGLILSYRLCDSIWGPFAYPFYLEELRYTNDEVAFASKIFGVGMTIIGVSLGGVLFATLGRMPTLLIGAMVAAASNLLYADLAAGAPVIDAVAGATGLLGLGVDARMVRLMVAISGENIAGGLAGAAFVAYLSSIASKEHSAVQYALLSSLTLLVGSLGRAGLGEAVEQMGYAPVFRFTAALGLVAIGFVLLEWVRWRREVARYGLAPEAAR
ncbi:AmpG family muropeptide MFS transporter [Sphingomonas sp. CFBP 13720]|uniref:AmpG family muropeptide MFS transporter n=1 Tax=Sphingomonas sp. CFBP 13720 TaxID=2775302 RepID=UPI002016F1D3|nr:MFS transporter [Sphingomonas sp. CFBP 13720]